MSNEGQAMMYRERALAQAQWERKNVVNKLDDRGVSHPNPHYVKRELIDGKVVETMPNKIIEVKEEK